MPELVITRPAQLVAGGVVVVLVAHHPHSVGDGRHWAVVGKGVPLRARHKDAAVGGGVDQGTRPGAWGEEGMVGDVKGQGGSINYQNPIKV